MKIDLTDMTAVVTGSTVGIGLAIAKRLAQAGAKVVINGRKQETVDKGVAAVHAASKRRRSRAWPPTSRQPKAARRSSTAVPSVDILINNAGIFEPKEFFEIPDAEWTRLLRDERHVGRAPVARLYAGHARTQLGTHHFHLIGIGSEHSDRDDPLRLHQDGAAVDRARARAADGRHERNRQLSAARPDAIRRRRRIPEGDGALRGKTADEMAGTFVKTHGQRRSSSVSRPSRRSRIWSIYAASKEASATNGAALRVEGGILRTIG